MSDPSSSNVKVIRGQFGTPYPFVFFWIPRQTDQIPKSAGLYIVGATNEVPEGELLLKGLFLGQANDFSTILTNHPKSECFEQNGANVIGVLPLPDLSAAIPIKIDLSALDWPCGIE